jgi:hypothetical protein
MVREKDVERAAGLEHRELGDDLRQRDVFAIVAVDALQARGAAGDVVRLLLDDEAEARLNGSRGRPSFSRLDG